MPSDEQSVRPEKPDAPPEGDAPSPPPAGGNGSGARRAEMDPSQIAEALSEFVRQSQDGGLAPPGEDETPVTREDLTLRRKHGRPEPIKVRTPLGGHVVEIVPLKWGVGRKMRLAHRGLQDLEDEELVEIVREHVVTPDLSEIDLDWAEEHLDWETPLDLAAAVIRNSRSEYRMKLPRVQELDEDGQGKE